MYVKVLDNITAVLKRGKGGKGEETAFSLPYSKVSHFFVVQDCLRVYLKKLRIFPDYSSQSSCINSKKASGFWSNLRKMLSNL